MELRHLRHFVAVAEELHFARAATRLGIEQSPLSHSIRNLEAELNVKLFQRSTRRTWLTQSGARFYKQVKRILNDIDVATASLRRTDDDGVETVRIALGEDLASEPFTRLLFEIEQHPSRPALDIRELTHTDAARLVRDGATDVALTLDCRGEDGLQQYRAWSEPLVLIVPIGHRLAGEGSASLADTAGERLALPLFDACPGYLSQINDLLKRYDLASVDTVSVTHWNTAISFVATGRAVALFPRSLAIGNTSVAVVPLIEDDAVLTTWLLYLGEEPSSPASLVLALAAMIGSDVDSRLEAA
jgi:DNA-binding transcriptional LysR family regulator